MERTMSAILNKTNGIANTLTLDDLPPEVATHPPADRVRTLQRLLGEPACRQLGIYPIPAEFKLSVVIPVFNEKQWIRELLRRVHAVPIHKEIIIVDDCSTDGT